VNVNFEVFLYLHFTCLDEVYFTIQFADINGLA